MPTPDELPEKAAPVTGDKLLMHRAGAMFTSPFEGFVGPGISGGGVTGQFLMKASGANYDTTWTTAPILTDGDKGDIVVSDTAQTWTIDSTTLTPFGRTIAGSSTAGIARTALELGSAALSPSSSFAAATHTHPASQITDFNTAADARIALQKAAVNGLATLDAGGKIPTAQLPNLAITDTFVVANQAAMLALTAEVGDVAVRTDVNRTFILRVTPASTLSNWQEMLTPTDQVLSVNGFTGVVSLTTANISENTNLYFTDERAQDAVGNILTASASIDFTYNDAGNTITATVIQSGLTLDNLSGTLALAKGGTGATTQAGARTALGLGTAALSATTDFLAASTALDAISGTLSVTKGGTGAITAPNARTNLGLVIGTDVQAQNARLQDIATNLSATTGAIEKTAANTFGTYAVTAFGKSLVDDVDAATARTTLGLPAASTFPEATIAEIAAGTASRNATAANINQFLGYGTYLFQAANQTIANGGAGDVLVFGTGSTGWDDGNWHSETVNNSRITFDFTGRVFVNASVRFNTTAASLYILILERNGVEIARTSSALGASGAGATVNLAITTAVTTGDHFILRAFQNTGAAVGTVGGQTYFQVTRVR